MGRKSTEKQVQPAARRRKKKFVREQRPARRLRSSSSDGSVRSTIGRLSWKDDIGQGSSLRQARQDSSRCNKSWRGDIPCRQAASSHEPTRNASNGSWLGPRRTSTKMISRSSMWWSVSQHESFQKSCKSRGRSSMQTQVTGLQQKRHS